MRALFSIFFLFIALSSYSQDCYDNNNKIKRVCNRAYNLIMKKNHYKAQKILKKQLKYHKDNPEIKRIFSILYWAQGEILLAEDYALEVIDICPDYNPEIYFMLGKINFNRRMYIYADKYLKKALSLGLDGINIEEAVRMQKRAQVIAEIILNPVPFIPKIVTGVSTKADEYLPILSPDQELFFFTRRGVNTDLGSLTDFVQEKFIYSSKEDSDFSSGLLMPPPFNINSNEGGASITIDNRILYFTKCSSLLNGYNNCDLFYTYKNDTGWSEIMAFKKKINGLKSWESQPTVSANGQEIIFASDRAGGFGGSDLYIIRRDENGEWSNPENLGENINTKDNEKSPFLHIDNETLFFSSDQFPSVGGYDIFYSRKDSLNRWRMPTNIGFPINTVSDELGLFVSTDGDKAYFASNQLEGIGGWDLFKFDLYDKAKPQKILFLKGVLKDENSNTISDASIDIKNLRTKERYNVNVQDGEYAIAINLKGDDDFLISINKEGYAFNSEYISSSEKIFNSPSTIDFTLEKLAGGRSFRLDNIYFASNSFNLNRVSEEILISFSDYLKVNESLNLSIHGHTDNIGSANTNLLLSKNRAKQVSLFLIANGISKERLAFEGFGEEKPITSNETHEGRAQNRRTEFLVIE
jgi:outer membrane protein OmpA-like peptidoglycan-associated protein/tetratricopeptide (TPR) repeat protein